MIKFSRVRLPSRNPTVAWIAVLYPLASGSAFAAVNASDYGVSASNGDNASALERAFAAGRGQEVVLPAGTIRYSRAVKADSVKIKGSSGTIMAPSNPENQRIFLTGNSPSISDVRFDFKPTQRCGACVEKAGVWVQNAKNFKVEGVTFNGHANGVPSKHGNGGGNLFVKNSQGGEIRNNRLYGTLADAIHMTGGSRDIDVTGNRIENASDDGIAVVAYGKDGTGDIRINGNTVIGNRWGRNITAVGSDNVRITNNYIKGNSADGAGVYVASEPAYNTDAPKNILIQGNSIQDTGGPGKGHGQVMLWSGKGPISGVTVKDNEIRDSKRDDLAVVLSGSMSDVTLDGNDIDGEISRRNGGSYGGDNNTTNDAAMENAAPIPVSTPAPSQNSGDNGFVDEGPGEQGNEEMAGGNGGVGQTLDRIQTEACGTDAGRAMTTASAVSGLFGGGRATLPAQLAQQVQLIFHSVCASRQLEAQLKMIAALGINTGPDLLRAMQVVQNALGQAQRVTYELAKADAEWQRVFIQTNGIQTMPYELTFPALHKRYAEMRDYTSSAMAEAARIRAINVNDMRDSNSRIKQIADASATAIGPTQAAQAGNLLLQETRRSIEGMHQTVLSYNEAQSRIDQQKTVESVLAQIFFDKNMDGMNTTPTPEQGAVIFADGQQQLVATPEKTAGSAKSAQTYDPFAIPQGVTAFGSGSLPGAVAGTLAN